MKSIQLAVAFGIVMSCAVAQTPSVVSGGVINGASFDKGQPVSPGSLVSIFGSNLASSLLVGSTIPLSTSLSNVTVTFNDVPAGLYYVSGGQINAQLPWNVLAPGATGTVNAVVTSGGLSSAAVSVPVAPFSPGIFSFLVGSNQYAIATIFPDNALAAPAGAAPGSRPAKAGDTLTLYTTGLGPVDHQIDNGQIPPAGTLYRTTSIPTVFIGGANAPVSFSGLSPQFVGINQLNVVVPSVAAGSAVPIQIEVGGVTSGGPVFIAVQ